MSKSGKTGAQVGRRAPARSLEARENQMIDLAVDLAERQLREGTASSQVITHYLRLGATRERYEQERLRADVELKKAQIQNLNKLENIESMYADAIESMTRYRIPHNGEEWHGR